MKYFVSKIIPKLSSFSKKLDKITVICDRKWKMLDDEGESTSYIFREKNELLIIKKGEVKKAKWEIINQNDILIEQETASFLFRQAFIDENIFVLNVDGTDSYVYFIDGEKTDVKNIEQLESLLKGKYLPEPKPTIIESNVEAKKQIDSKAKNDSDSPIAVILISIFLIVGVFIAISHLNQKSNSSENEIKKQSPLPSEGLILDIIDTHFDRFIEENSRQENFIYFSGRVEELSNSFKNLSNVKDYYPNIFDEKNEFYKLVFDTMFGFTLIISLENNQDKKTSSWLSRYKDFYDIGEKKDFCALIIGKLQRNYVAKNDIKAHEVALKWFMKSETVSAYLNIASYYENGVASGGYFPEIIIKRNKKEALKWYKKAADLGSAEAKEKVNLLSL